MGGAPLLLALAAVSIDYGWQPDDAGGLEYIVQIPPEQLEELQSWGHLTSHIDPAVRGQVSTIVLRVGDGPLPRTLGDLADRRPSPDETIHSVVRAQSGETSGYQFPDLGTATREAAADAGRELSQQVQNSLRGAADQTGRALQQGVQQSVQNGAQAAEDRIRNAAQSLLGQSGSSTTGNNAPGTAQDPRYSVTSPQSDPPRVNNWSNTPPQRPSTDPFPASDQPRGSATSGSAASASAAGSNGTAQPNSGQQPSGAQPGGTAQQNPGQPSANGPPRFDGSIAGSASGQPPQSDARGQAATSTPGSSMPWNGGNTSAGDPSAAGASGGTNPWANSGASQAGAAAGGGYNVPPAGNTAGPTANFGTPPAGMAGSTWPPATSDGYAYPTAPAAGQAPPQAIDPRYYQAPATPTYGSATATPWPNASPAPSAAGAVDPRALASEVAREMRLADREERAERAERADREAEARDRTRLASSSSAADDVASPTDRRTAAATQLAATSRPAVANAKATTAQPFFNGLLLVSLVANAYLLITLSKLLQRYRNLIASVRSGPANS